jgi:hypothetical protein
MCSSPSTGQLARSMLVPAKAGIEIHPRRDAKTSAVFLQRFLAQFPAVVHTILTDNGSEFTDRFAVDPRLREDGL